MLQIYEIRLYMLTFFCMIYCILKIVCWSRSAGFLMELTGKELAECCYNATNALYDGTRNPIWDRDQQRKKREQ